MPSHPGYGAPELRQGIIHAENDIYSFGRTFYVLLHHHFPNESNLQETRIDRFLLKCCAEDQTLRFHTIEEMRKELDHLSKSFLHRNRQKLLFGICILCVLSALLFGQWHERNKERNYAALLSNHRFEEAILYRSNDLRAYQEYVAYELQEYGEDGRDDTVNRILLLYETYPLEMKSDIARYLIQECIKSKNPQLYIQAAQMITEKEPIEESIYLPLLSSELSQMERERYLAQIRSIVMAMEQEQRAVHLELLIACYEYQPITTAATFEHLIDLYGLQKEYVKQQNLQYSYALWLCEEDPASMKPYVMELEKQWHTPQQMRLLGNLYMEVFEETIKDEDKGRELLLLKKAEMCFTKWKETYSRDESVDALLAQIQYLMEKWR